ncbi:hypothetical protein EVAR_15832_1 [Eumeta japonica]|uniref:Uncharacterized protein n=1 Tax=Eumeta variegata TaxID=151549 RepID=A0A4C1UF97_EUMVA|nr:hypothetical protein EVAR_15832_1 [Eumeta japonica]
MSFVRAQLTNSLSSKRAKRSITSIISVLLIESVRSGGRSVVKIVASKPEVTGFDRVHRRIDRSLFQLQFQVRSVAFASGITLSDSPEHRHHYHDNGHCQHSTRIGPTWR